MAIVPLDRSLHGDLTFAPKTDLAFTENLAGAPLLAFEIIPASICFPVIFPAEGNALPHAMLSLDRRNAYLRDGRWEAPYMPCIIANQPFSLASISRAGDAPDAPLNVVVSAEMDAPQFKEPGGERLYDGDEPSPLLQRISQGLALQHRRHAELLPLLHELNNVGVLEVSTVPVPLPNGGKVDVAGLRIVSREKVLALSDATLASWARSGLMEMVYAHWRSLGNLPRLLAALPADKLQKKQ